MISAAEQFAIELGRASKRGQRYLRHLSAADRDDVVASAMLSCWEARSEYDASKQSLETWFAQHLKLARREFKREPRHLSTEKLTELIAPDDTERAVDTAQAASEIAANLTEIEHKVLELIGEGYSMRDVRIMVEGAHSGVTRRMYNKLRRLRELLPDPAIALTPRPRPQDSDTLAPIDHEIEKMLRRPMTTRADCPVCWRCCYFLGLEPKNWRPPKNVDFEIQLAVQRTEERKIAIAQRGYAE